MSEMAQLKQLLEEQGKAWEEFQTANDARIAAIEQNDFAPADLTEKVNTINAEITRLSQETRDITKRINRPSFGSGRSEALTEDQAEHKAAVAKYLRRGEERGLHDLERKALNIGSDPDGGYLVGSEMEREIDRVASDDMGFRAVANERPIGGASYKKLVKTSGVSGGWIGEQEDSSESTGPQFSEIEIVPHRDYAEPWVTNDMLEDSQYDLEADLTEEVGITLAETEGTAFITGTGVKQPRGLLSYTAVANASYAWGSVGYIASGADGAFASSNPSDALVNLIHALRLRYRSGARWLLNDLTLSGIRKFKDGNGIYLWQPGLQAGVPESLLGYPVTADDNMPDIASDSLSVAFGNFRRAYTVVPRRGIAVIRDNLTKKGTTKFHFSRRIGGGITHFEAVKLMKFATS